VRKAFIAAPLIGTFIFLASIAFVVNLSNTEKLASAQVVSDAYHNRLVSLLEIYRTDLASIFREGIIRTTEYFLLRQGWNEFELSQNSLWISGVDWSTGTCTGTGCSSFDQTTCLSSPGCIWNAGATTGGSANVDGSPDGKVSYEELRFVKCDNIRVLTSQIICSLPQTIAAGAVHVTYDYGLPQWMDKLTVPLPFEGMTFDVANNKSMRAFIPEVDASGHIDPADAGFYQGNCSALMKGSIFDCNNFAHNEASPYRCCSNLTSFDKACTDTDIPSARVVPGCEDGSFFLNVSLNNSIVYPAMPRLNASDGRGNQIRSGAIGESDFLLPINYPLFRYYHYAFGVYKKLAYGENDGNPENNGVSNGLCRGGADCATIEVSPGVSFGSVGFGSPDASQDVVMRDVEDKLFARYKEACSEFSNSNVLTSLGADLTGLTVTGLGLDGGQVVLQSLRTGADYVYCTDIMQQVVVGGTEPVDALDAQMDSQIDLCGDPAAGLSCAYYEQPNFKFQFKDFDPAYQVDPDEQNFFRWSAAPTHDVP